MPFEDKVAVVTGAAQGIGEAYATALAARGCSVLVADLNAELAAAVAGKLVADGGKAAAVRVDVSDPDSAKAMAAFAVETFGGIDLLVNNAAIYGDMEFNSLTNVDWDYYRRFMSVNLDGALLCSRACFKSMRKRGGGAIVNQARRDAGRSGRHVPVPAVGRGALGHRPDHQRRRRPGFPILSRMPQA